MPTPSIKYRLPVMACPACRQPLTETQEALQCTSCQAVYSLVEGVPVLLAQVEDRDRVCTEFRQTSQERLPAVDQSAVESYYAFWRRLFMRHNMGWGYALLMGARDDRLLAGLLNISLYKSVHVLDSSLSRLLATDRLYRKEEERTTRLPYLYTAAATALPFKTTSVESVLAEDILSRAEDRSALLREAHRVLKPGGKAAFLEPSLEGELHMLQLARTLLAASVVPLEDAVAERLQQFVTDTQMRVADWPDQWALRDEMQQAGFGPVHRHNMPLRSAITYEGFVRQYLVERAGLPTEVLAANHSLVEAVQATWVDGLGEHFPTPWVFYVLERL